MNDNHTVLVIEDEANIRSFMTTILKANKFNVILAQTGEEGIMCVTTHCPDVIILDLGLPDIDGTEVIEKVRQWSQVPIIVVSAREREKDKVEALDLGADDYITKPFGTSELLARVRTALRHLRNDSINQKAALSGKFIIDNLTVDYDKRRVYIDNKDANLTQTEYRLMAILSKYAGKVLTYEFIIKELWGPNATSDNQTLRVNMANIRRKIEENPAEPKYIITEMGVGYRMIDNE